MTEWILFASAVEALKAKYPRAEDAARALRVRAATNGIKTKAGTALVTTFSGPLGMTPGEAESHSDYEIGHDVWSATAEPGLTETSWKFGSFKAEIGKFTEGRRSFLLSDVSVDRATVDELLKTLPDARRSLADHMGDPFAEPRGLLAGMPLAPAVPPVTPETKAAVSAAFRRAIAQEVSRQMPDKDAAASAPTEGSAQKRRGGRKSGNAGTAHAKFIIGLLQMPDDEFASFTQRELEQRFRDAYQGIDAQIPSDDNLPRWVETMHNYVKAYRETTGN